MPGSPWVFPMHVFGGVLMPIQIADKEQTPGQFALAGNARPAVAVVVPMLSLGALMALVVRLASMPLSNPDTWFHLAIGRALLGDWSVEDPGSLSSFATADWAPTQWSVQMLAAVFEDWFGLPGVAWLFGALELLLVVTLYLTCRDRASPLASAVVCVVAVFGAGAALSARPQVISLILLAVSVAAWLRTSRDLQPRWWLVPLTWAWANAHGFWSIGVVLGLVCSIGLLLDRRLDRRAAMKLVGVPVAALLAACLTPVGPQLLSAQFAVSARSEFIGEWAPTSFRALSAVVVAGMVTVVVALWARRGGVPWTSVLLLVLAVALAAYAVRMVALAAVITAPLLAAALQQSMRSVQERGNRSEVLLLAAGLIVSLGALAVLVPRTADRPDNVPLGLTAELSRLPSGSPVMVDGTVGSWIEWRFPRLNPTMDGMFDAYTLEYMREYQAARNLQPGWKHFIARTGARVAVLTQVSPLTHAMKDALGWEEVDRDGRWVFLEAPAE